MNINCPQCSAYLTVPEQYAGQLMKCPKCSSNFTVPALPAIDQEPAFATGSGSPSASSSSSPAPSSGMAPPIPLSPEVPAFSTAAPEPAFATSPPHSSAASAASSAASETAHAARTSAKASATPSSHGSTPTSSTEPLAGDRRSFTVPLPMTILQWVPVACVVLIFFLQFFPWVGVYPGGVPVVTQGAWGAAFGDYSQPDPDMKGIFTIETEADVRAKNEKLPADSIKYVSNEPGKSLLLIFYLMPFFLVTLIVCIGVAVLPYVHVQLPPALANLLPWKWAIIAGLNAILLLFLAMQLLLNFGLESSVKAWAQNRAEMEVKKLATTAETTNKKVEDFDTKERKMLEARAGTYISWLQRTIWLRLVVLLQLVATLAAALVYWMDKHRVPEVYLEGAMRW